MLLKTSDRYSNGGVTPGCIRVSSLIKKPIVTVHGREAWDMGIGNDSNYYYDMQIINWSYGKIPEYPLVMLLRIAPLTPTT